MTILDEVIRGRNALNQNGACASCLLASNFYHQIPKTKIRGASTVMLEIHVAFLKASLLLGEVVPVSRSASELPQK